MDDPYEHPAVRARIIEYLGGLSVEESTAVFLVGGPVMNPAELDLRPVSALEECLDGGFEISRSLWDRKSLLAHLDIEYVNFDYPAEPYLHLERSFALQEPLARTVEALLHGYGIDPLHLVTGRGHHYIWKIDRDSTVFAAVASLGHVSASLRGVYAHPRVPTGEQVPDDLGEAFSGLGHLMEHLAYRIKEKAAPLCRIPVELTDVYVGPGERGREMISIDISEYGDPLTTRMIRIPFTVYRKPRGKGIAGDPGLADAMPLLYMIPYCGVRNIGEAIGIMRDPQAVADLAASCSTAVPDGTEGTGTLIEEYVGSSSRAFHDWFYAQEHEPPERWPFTYDRMPAEALPLCARSMLAEPNDVLLKPAGIEFLVRSMLALGWHPRHIAGLIRSKYERDYGWGPLWYRYDAATRADFYARIFTGLFVTGRDDLVSFNCLSTKEKGLCLNPEAWCGVDGFRESLLQRRIHARLAHRPFNRLFLPYEHL